MLFDALKHNTGIVKRDVFRDHGVKWCSHRKIQQSLTQWPVVKMLFSGIEKGSAYQTTLSDQEPVSELISIK